MNFRGMTKNELIKELVELKKRLDEASPAAQNPKKEPRGNLDLLTGLPNRTLFFDRLSLALHNAQRNKKTLAVLFLSLENLTLINDALGHNIGDLLLKEVSERLGGSLRSSDTVARPGRDEFMILLPEITKAEDAAVVAEKLLLVLGSLCTIEGQEIFVNSNIGISIFPEDDDHAEGLIKKSYAAMQRAKEQGKNEYMYFSPSINERAFERLVIENGLRNAVMRNEFVLHYQPQINLRIGRIVGLEALVRWQRPGFGLVPPGKFIHHLEENGLIVPLGEWVLKTACIQAKAWQKAGHYPLRMAVNLSARQFHQKNLAGDVMRVLEKTGLEPQSLELELTESIFIGNIEAAVETLAKLRDMGVSISIDDFGTGYSSLSYLKHLPINKLKIVHPFIRSLALEPDNTVIAKTIVAMAHSLNLTVIAEGVENSEHLKYLFELGCDELQGDIISHPAEAGEIERLLSKEIPCPHLRGI